MENKVAVDTTAIYPMADIDETQIILQRHCNYDRDKGNLVEESIIDQKKVVIGYLSDLEKQDLANTYFLFIASNTMNKGQQKRAVDTIHIAMKETESFLLNNGISKSHILNLDECLNYQGEVKQTAKLSEPKMLTQKDGYLEFLKEKNVGMNLQFWIDFEEDKYKEIREQLGAEGPDEIVERGVFYVQTIQRYAEDFHLKFPHSKLIVWCGTHYDLISPFVKQKIFNLDKSAAVFVEYCGGISLKIDSSNNIIANVNGSDYPIGFEDSKQLRRHL